MTHQCHRYFHNEGIEKRTLQIQYEQFMHRPDEVASGILAHLGAENTPAFSRKVSQARTTSIGKHSERPEEEVRAATTIAKPMLETLGYLE